MKLNLAIEALEISLEEIKKTENLKRLAEANNLALVVQLAKEELKEGIPDEELAEQIRQGKKLYEDCQLMEAEELLHNVGLRVRAVMEDINNN